MSYSCTISFKTIPAEDIYDFLLSLKNKTTESFGPIAENNFIFSPFSKKSNKEDDKAEMHKAFWETTDWARMHVFTYRYFYLKEHQLLGVYSLNEEQQELFDCTVYFQNSCDQDYEFTEWQGVSWFEEVAAKWANATDEAVLQKYKEKYNEDFGYDYEGYAPERLSEKLMYYRRTFAYKEIWELIEPTLYHENGAVYVSLYGGYELSTLSEFATQIKDKYYAWLNSVHEEEGKKTT